MKLTLIVVADAGHLRLFSTDDRGASIAHLPGDTDSIPNPPSREHKSDRPGRAFKAGGTRRPAMEPRSDPHRKAEESFAKEVAGHVGSLLSSGAYKNAVLFAPPAFLGALRQDFSEATTKMIAAQIHKDVIKLSTDEIRDHVRSVLLPSE
ncbi:MAG: host attachment protein [Alphaproteobacteria bacterium]